jgi:lambda family phage tail tape measure protein
MAVIPLRIDHNLQETTVSALSLTKAEEKLRLETTKLNKLYKSGKIDLDRYKRSLDQLNREFDEFRSGQFDATNGFARFNRAAQGSAQTLKRRFNTGLQQAGFQVGDFAVQVQGGTNAMVALGQQGSQLLGILGPYGAIAGAGLAIGTAILAPLLDSAKAAGNLNRTLKELAERRDELNRETEFLESGFDFKEQVDIRDEILRLEGEIEEAQQRAATSAGRNRRAATLQIEKLQSDIQELIDLEESYGEALENNRSAEYLKELDQQNLADLARLQGELLLENLKYEKEQKELLELSQKAAFDLVMHASNIDFSRPVAQAIKLADALGISVQRALLLTPGAMGNLPTSSPDSRSDAYDSTEAELQRMKEIINQGFSGKTDNGSRSVGGSASQQENNLEKLIKRIQLQKELLGLTEAEAFVLRALGDERSQYTEQQIDAITKETESWMKRRDALEKAKTNQEDFFDSLNSNLESVISGLVSGNKTLAESFADLYLGIADQLFKVLALQHMLNATGGIFSMIPGFDSIAQTGIIGGMVDTFSKGGVVERYASGGIVSQSTAFPMTNGIGLMGEAGAEAILPLSRDSKGNLGVKSESGPVNIVFNISTPNADSFRKSEAQIASRMSRALANADRNR